jgi:DNA polymerase-3 subunit delta'
MPAALSAETCRKYQGVVLACSRLFIRTISETAGEEYMGIGDLTIPEQVRRALLRAIRDQRLPPAYLLVGPTGVGKRTTALALAKALNCLSPAGDACDRCAVCLRIDRQLHPDIHLVEPQGQVIKIDQIRQLRETLTLQAYEARVKVAILDDAGQLTIEGVNSLLKILEEPPSQTLFVLVSQQLGNLPATLISRAQVLRFGLMACDQVVAFLRRHAWEPDEAERAAHLSGGRPGAALTLDLATVQERRADALQLLTQALAGDPSVLLASAEQWAKRKGDHPLLFAMLLSLLRDIAVAQAGGHDAQFVHKDVRDTLPPWAAAMATASVWEIFEVVHSTQEAMAHNVNPQLAFEVMLFKIGDAYERARRRDRHRQQYTRV